MISFLPVLADAAAKAAVVLGASWVVAGMLPARHRVLALRGAAAIVLLMPAIALAAAARPAVIALPGMTASALPAIAVPAFHATAHAQSVRFDWSVLIGTVWLLGAMLVAGRYVLSLMLLTRRFARGREVSCALKRNCRDIAIALYPGKRVGMRVAAGIATPCTFGWWRPKILLPEAMAANDLGPVVEHELCHARNGDAFWLMVWHMACALYWFNPLTWFCAARHRATAEAVCDDDVVWGAVDVEDYVRALLSAAGGPVPAAAAGALAASLQTRIRQLLARETPLPRITAMARSAVLMTMAVAAIICADGRVIASAAAPAAKAENPAWEAVVKAAPLRPGEAMLYVDAGPRVTVASPALGFVCGDGSCQFTVPAGRIIVMHGDAEGAIAWQGCTPQDGGRVCAVRIDASEIHVNATLR